jgi:hypothetical protein
VTPEQQFALGVLILIGAIVVGYVVRCVVPDRHYPRTAGLLAANALPAGLAVFGIEAAAYVVFILVFLTVRSLSFGFPWMLDVDEE